MVNINTKEYFVKRLLADGCHILAILLLLDKILKSRSCSGISAKSQILFAIVFYTRYIDLFYNFVSLYNSIMKVAFICSSTFTVYLICYRYRTTASKEDDSFRLIFLIAPIAGLSFLVNYSRTVQDPYMILAEISWAFSIYLESVAILPQLFMISKTGEAESITSHYLFALGMYRAFYILNWIYRYHEEQFFDIISVVAGCLQTILYLDFFYLYITRVLKSRGLVLPV